MRFASCIVDAAHDGMPAYDVLRSQIGASDGSVRRAKHVEGGMLLDGVPAWARDTVREGQKLELAIAGPGLPGSHTELPAEHGPVSVVYADEDVVVLDKPAGLVMYPGPGHAEGTLANRLAGWLERQGMQAGVQAVHRLDAGTSGLVLFALHSFAKERLSAQLHTEDFARAYLAVCMGCPQPATGGIEVPLGKLSSHPNVYGVVADGKPAHTDYQVLASGPGAGGAPLSLVALQLQTGRTHQIRIHMAHIGHPLVGDDAYGRPSPLIARPALHSARLSFTHPVTRERLTFESALPQDMRALGACGSLW